MCAFLFGMRSLGSRRESSVDFFRAIFAGVARVSFRFSGSSVGGSKKKGDLRTPYREASRRSREPNSFLGLVFPDIEDSNHVTI